MIVTLIGYQPHSFTDKKDGRKVEYVSLYCIEAPEDHKDNTFCGHKFLQFNSTRLTTKDITIGEVYEVIMSDPRRNNDGSYTTRPISLRPLS